MAVSRRKVVVGALGAVVTCAGAYGFAATLASGSSGLGAGSKVVASCGSGMRLAYTSGFSPADSGYVVNGIDLSSIPAGCHGRSLSVTFYDSGGATVRSTVSTTLTASRTTQSIAVPPLDAGRVSGVSVVVT